MAVSQEEPEVREVRCDLLDIAGGAKIAVVGKKDASRLVLCQAGFPDDRRPLLPLARRLASEGDCLVGVSCMPEYDTASDGPLRKPDGYTFDESAICFGQAVAALRSEARNPAAPLTLILHDWGIAPGAIYANRCLKGGDAPPSRVVFFDVLPEVKVGDTPRRPTYELLVHLNYQATFAVSFLLNRFSNVLAQLFVGIGSAVVFGLFGRWLNPVGPLDAKSASITNPVAFPRICYPYYHMFRELLVRRGALLTECSMPPLAQVPVLYMYGKVKNTMFHSKEALQALDDTKGCEQVGVDAAGHWLYLHRPEECFRRVLSFITGA